MSSASRTNANAIPSASPTMTPRMTLRLVFGCTREALSAGPTTAALEPAACSVCSSSRSRRVASTRRDSADPPSPDATIASSFRRVSAIAAESAALSSRWRYARELPARTRSPASSATAGLGSATENVRRSAVGFALTLEFASSAAAV